MKGRSSLFDGKRSRIASGDISFMGNGKRADFARYISNRPDKDPNGMFDVIAHGTSKFIEVSAGNKTYLFDARQAANLIRRQQGFSKSKSVRLLSCSTGADPAGFAQHLANALGKPVYAPNNIIYSYPNGKYWIKNVDSKTRGEFIEFKPGGIKHGK